jgi:hypothetical protein
MGTEMNRRTFATTLLAMPLFGGAALAATPQITVYKTPTCGCCSAWVAHMEQAGFAVTARDVAQEVLWGLKSRAGLTPELGSCHTAFVEGYVVEGHVPAADVQRLLSERPDARGLTVPGMPIGSPGMEMGATRDRFDTLLVMADGGTSVFATHN